MSVRDQVLRELQELLGCWKLKPKGRECYGVLQTMPYASCSEYCGGLRALSSLQVLLMRLKRCKGPSLLLTFFQLCTSHSGKPSEMSPRETLLPGLAASRAVVKNPCQIMSRSITHIPCELLSISPGHQKDINAIQRAWILFKGLVGHNRTLT